MCPEICISHFSSAGFCSPVVVLVLTSLGFAQAHVQIPDCSKYIVLTDICCDTHFLEQHSTSESVHQCGNTQQEISESQKTKKQKHLRSASPQAMEDFLCTVLPNFVQPRFEGLSSLQTPVPAVQWRPRCHDDLVIKGTYKVCRFELICS